jgi:hypothetical protein
MTRRTWAWLAVLAVGVSFTGLSQVALARAADKSATGTWKWTFTRQNGDTIDVTLKLKQEGDKLTGTMTGPGGNETEIKDGTIKDGTVTFKVERERDGNKFVTSYNGKLDGDTIKGKAETEFNGEKRERDWEAKRGS